jgi:hypothetical protein
MPTTANAGWPNQYSVGLFTLRLRRDRRNTLVKQGNRLSGSQYTFGYPDFRVVLMNKTLFGLKFEVQFAISECHGSLEGFHSPRKSSVFGASYWSAGHDLIGSLRNLEATRCWLPRTEPRSPRIDRLKTPYEAIRIANRSVIRKRNSATSGGDVSPSIRDR